EVTVYNRTPSRARALVEHGARAAAQVADACRGDAVITMLADDGAVEGVVFGENGVIEVLGKGAIHVSMSTISVALSERLAAAHANAGQGFVAAPVFGRPEAAAAGKLFIVAEGKFEPAGFAAALGEKDIRLTLAAAETLRVPMPLASLLRDRFLTLLAHGGEALDWSAIGQLAAKDAGLGDPPSGSQRKQEY